MKLQTDGVQSATPKEVQTAYFHGIIAPHILVMSDAQQQQQQLLHQHDK